MERKVKPGYKIIWVKYFRHPKTGKLIHAEKYGKKAFPLRVRKS